MPPAPIFTKKSETNQDKLFVTDFSDGAGPEFSAPRELPIVVRSGGLAPGFAMRSDGRIVTAAPVGNTTTPAIHLILNWSKLL